MQPRHDLVPGAVAAAPGRVIVLNGASSSGKSTLAAALQEALPGAWTVMSVDHVNRNRSRKDWSEDEFVPIHQRSILGFHRSVAGFASAGNDVIVDHLLGERWRYVDLRTVLAPFPVIWVALHCPLQVLERRESERGDRHLGAAARQLPVVHQGIDYDVEVDTAARSAAQCAADVATVVGC